MAGYGNWRNRHLLSIPVLAEVGLSRICLGVSAHEEIEPEYLAPCFFIAFGGGEGSNRLAAIGRVSSASLK